MSTAVLEAVQSPSDSTLALHLTRLRPDQRRIIEALRIYPVVVLAMGRRWGKTVLGYVLCMWFADRGAKVAWVVPSYKNGRPLWRMVHRAVAPLKNRGLVRVNETERVVEFADEVGGGFLGIYTGDDNCDAMRGEDFDLVVVDEAAKLAEVAWTDSIQPTLADRSGHALLISTPRGRNWFYREWVRGQDTERQQIVQSFTAPTSANPHPRIRRAAEMARERVSERTYQQEWLAEFVEDGGGVFRNVRACVAGALQEKPTPHHRYVVGVDLAKKEDFTVCVVMDENEQRVVAFDRYNKADWPMVKARILTLAHTWNDATVWLDSTGLGDPIYDDLKRATAVSHDVRNIRIQAYQLTAASKAALVDNAVLHVENQQVRYPRLPALIDELEAYEYVTMPSGHIRMQAPEGMHDDCVIAFALACWPLAHKSQGIPQAALEQMRGGYVSDFHGAELMKRVF